jgi:hypothetical protein
VSVNVLLSFAFHRMTDLATVRRNLVCGRLMIDSGAFTAHTKGTPVSLDAYAEFLEHWRDCWDHAVTLDVVGDPVVTRANTLRLHARGLPVMPVFTPGDSLSEFDAMVRDTGYVCVGGLVGTSLATQRQRVSMLQRRAERWGGGIHALGVGSVPVLRAARPYSGDSANASSAFVYGKVVYFDGEKLPAVKITDRVRLLRDRDHITAHGLDLGTLVRRGRLPSKAEGRGVLVRAMAVGYACADEHLKDVAPVPPPHTIAEPGGVQLYASVVRDHTADVVAVDRYLHAGPHLYSSVTGCGTVDTGATVELDTALHRDTVPSAWRVYGANHANHCRATGEVRS